MTTILLGVLIAVAILSGALIVFSETPKSAVALARHDLFKSRDKLFLIAKSGAVGFDHQGYIAARAMINSFIRYAHELSLTQLLLTRGLLRLQRLHPDTAAWDRAIASLPEPAKVQVAEVLHETMISMFRLMITRSVVLTGVAFSIFAAHMAYTMVHRVLHRIAGPFRSADTTSDALIEDILAHRPGRKFSKVVKQEAKRFEASEPAFYARAA